MAGLVAGNGVEGAANRRGSRGNRRTDTGRTPPGKIGGESAPRGAQALLSGSQISTTPLPVSGLKSAL